MTQPNSVKCEPEVYKDRYLFLADQSHVASWLGTVVLLAITATGCKNSTGEVPVKGRVTYQSAPLKSGSLTFYPGSGRTVTARISEGNYDSKLLPGDYTVTITPAPELPAGYKEGDPLPPPLKLVLPDIYTTRAKSILKATVKSSQIDAIDFDLKQLPSGRTSGVISSASEK